MSLISEMNTHKGPVAAKRLFEKESKYVSITMHYVKTEKLSKLSTYVINIHFDNMLVNATDTVCQIQQIMHHQWM